MKSLRQVKDLRLFRTNRIKNPPRYEDLAAQEALASVPTGWRVLSVLLCALVAITVALFVFRHFEHF